MRFWTCWDALDLDYRHEKRVFDLVIGWWDIALQSLVYIFLKWCGICCAQIMWSCDHLIFLMAESGQACPSSAKLKIAIGWRSKIGWSDWPKLFWEFIFYPNFGGQYLHFLWLDSCDSGLVWKPLIWTIGTKKSIRFGLLAGEILHFKDWVYYCLIYYHTKIW